MKEAATTWALVVGIDQYDAPSIRPLTGAANDAIAAIDWLRRLGVPVNQIIAHIVPTADNRQSVEAARARHGLPRWHDSARELDLFGSFQYLGQQQGTRLFVILSGHGMCESNKSRLFLTEEAGIIRDVYSHLWLNEYIQWLLSMPFRRQFLFVDGCQNKPYRDNLRPKITPTMYAGFNDYVADSRNGLIACYATSQDKVAAESNKRGIFLRYLLDALDPTTLEQLGPEDQLFNVAVCHDFVTGARLVDIDRVMRDWVMPLVQDEASRQQPSVDQTPQIELSGAAAAARQRYVYSLQDQPTAALTLDVAPKTGATSIRRLKLWFGEGGRMWPWVWELPQLPARTVDVPASPRVPRGVPVNISCSVLPGAAWRPIDPSPFVCSSDHDVTIELQAVGAESELALIAEDSVALAVKTRDRESGSPRYHEFQYDESLGDTIAGSLSADAELWPEASSMRSDPYVPLRDSQILGLDVELHEDGPVIRVPVSQLPLGKAVVTAWAQSLRSRVPDDVVVVPLRGEVSSYTTYTVQPGETLTTIAARLNLDPSALRGMNPQVAGSDEVDSGQVLIVAEDVATLPPNVRFVLPEGGADAIAGTLAEQPMLDISSPDQPPVAAVWRGGGDLSLRQLERSPAVRLEPGPTRLRIELPWGVWTEMVAVPADGDVLVTLPTTIGRPPLRVALHAERARRDGQILGLRGESPRAWTRPGLTSRHDVPMELGQAGSAAWALQPAQSARSQGDLLAILDTYPRIIFPIRADQTLAISLGEGEPRIEPLSPLAMPEWDRLISAGQFDALTFENIMELTRAKWFDALLGLAGAYAIYLASEWAYLTLVAENLRTVGAPALDTDLLSIVATEHDDRPLSPAATDRLLDHASRGAVPNLRWGVGLATNLLARAGQDHRLRFWQSELRQVEQTLSPNCIWTAWTEGEPRSPRVSD